MDTSGHGAGHLAAEAPDQGNAGQHQGRHRQDRLEWRKPRQSTGVSQGEQCDLIAYRAADGEPAQHDADGPHRAPAALGATPVFGCTPALGATPVFGATPALGASAAFGARAAARFAGACGVLAEFGPRTCTGLAGGVFAWFRPGLAPGFGTAIPACFPTRLPASFRTRLPTSFRSRLPAGLRARFADVGGDQGAAEHPGEDPDRVVPPHRRNVPAE